MTPFTQQFLNAHPALQPAVDYTITAHSGQLRLHGGPYHEHPIAVTQIILDRFQISDPLTLHAALFHDILEDTPITYEQLAAAWSTPIADLVRELTKPPRPPEIPKPQWSAQIYARLAHASPAAKIIKCADRIHNLSQMHLAGPDFQPKYLEDTKLLLPALQSSPAFPHLLADFTAILAIPPEGRAS